MHRAMSAIIDKRIAKAKKQAEYRAARKKRNEGVAKAYYLLRLKKAAEKRKRKS